MISIPHCARAAPGAAWLLCPLHLLCLWATGSNFTQPLAAAENRLTGFLAFGSLLFSGLEGITVINHHNHSPGMGTVLDQASNGSAAQQPHCPSPANC